MTEEIKNVDVKEEKCNCICQSKGFRKFLIVAGGTFVGVFCALSLFAALHKPPMMMHPAHFGGHIMRPAHCHCQHHHGFHHKCMHKHDFHKHIDKKFDKKIEQKFPPKPQKPEMKD